MIYWFKKKLSGENFPLDTEKQACDLLKRRDFKNLFEFVGKSSGKKYVEITSRSTKLNEKQYKKIMEAGGLDKVRKNLLDEAFQTELQEALDNPDKIIPDAHKYDVLNISGVPDQTSQVAQLARQLANR